MPTFNVEINSKPKQDGRYTILIRITHNRKHKRIALGKFIPKQYFNKGATFGHWIRQSYPNAKQLNKLIKHRISELDQAFSENQLKEKESSVQSVLNEINNPDQAEFFVYAEKVIKRCRTKGQYRTAEKRTHVLNKIEKFLKKRNLHFSDLTTSFLMDYDAYLHKLGNKTNTIHTDLKVIKAIINQAISENIIEHSENPFLSYRLKAEKTYKERLTEPEIEKIIGLELEEGTKLWHTRNYFLFSFYCAGVRFGDLAVLKWNNINEGRLHYTMNKTAGTAGAIKSIPLNSKAKGILHFYDLKGKKKTQYIFPLLDKSIDEKNIPLLKKQISSKNAQTNKFLKELATLAEIDKKVSFHVSRHSFAEIARKKTNDLYGISKALGHSDLKITQGYLEDLDMDSTDKTMYKIFGD